MGNDAIVVEGVHKDFILPHEKTSSLKSSFLKRVKMGRGTSEHQHALKDISFSVKKGEFFGIVGRNGSGKSTMLKILAEIYKPTKGNIKVNGKLVPFIELGVGFNPELTGKDNVYLSASLLGFSRSQINDMYENIVRFAELEKFMDQKLKNYSSGMQVRLAFSIATRVEADILLIDEVLAVGDADFQRKCYKYFKSLKKTGKSVVFVTHDMEAVKEYCDRALLIDDGFVQINDRPDLVADEYLKLFNRSQASETKKRASGKKDTTLRWGNGLVEISKATVNKKGDNLRVEATITAGPEPVDDIVFGFRFVNEKGDIVLGGNSLSSSNGQLIRMGAGEKLMVSFEFTNVLGHGRFSLGATVRLSDKVTICDNWDGIQSLDNIQKDAPYPVVAPASFGVKRR